MELPKFKNDDVFNAFLDEKPWKVTIAYFDVMGYKDLFEADSD